MSDNREANVQANNRDANVHADNREANVQNNIASFNKYEWVTRDDEIGYDMEEDCPIVNGALAPEPISFAIKGRPPITIPNTNNAAAESSQPMQRQKKSIPIRTTEAKLRLWRNNIDDCILGIHEVATNNFTYYNLSPYVIKDKKRIKAMETQVDIQTLIEITEEVSELDSKKYNLTMQERLDGPWVLAKTQRSETNAKTDLVYKHPKAKKLRSLNELATFIMYAETY